MIVPNSKIILLKTPMELNDSNTLSFATETEKYNYFHGLTKLELTGATYQRKEGVVRYPTDPPNLSYEDLQEYNYCMYQNTNYDSKWFYAYIDDITYKNDGMCEIKLKSDPFMCWQNDIIYKSSFIERQHVSDDTIGKHTVPEGLETGEYIVLTSASDIQNISLDCVVSTSLTSGEMEYIFGGSYNGIPSGLIYQRYALNEISGTTGSTLQAYLTMLANAGKTSAVSSIFLAPKWLTGNTTNHYVPTSSSVSTFDFTINRISAIDTYVPKNNKLFTYPYCFTELSNNQGSSAILHQELWGDDVTTGFVGVRVFGSLCPGCSIRAVPKNYKGLSFNYNEGVNLGKFPQINWVTDAYTNWLTQNGVNIATSVGSGILSTGIGLSRGNPIATAGGFLSIARSIGEVYKHSLVPPQVEGNTNCGDVATSAAYNCFILYNKSIRREYAKIIDDYFTMYGYKVNSLEVINPHKRTYFDYIKTIGCNIIGNIPQKDMEEIRRLFDNGITIWHDPTKFLDYSVTNSIIS